MAFYARIGDCAGESVVAEIITTSEPVETLFHPSLQWRDVTGLTVKVGWIVDPFDTFHAPPLPKADLSEPTLATLQAQLDSLTTEISRLLQSSAPANPATKQPS